MNSEPRIEIVVTEKGVQSVRAYGDGWKNSQRALALLNLVQAALIEIDEAVKGGRPGTLGDVHPAA